MSRKFRAEVDVDYASGHLRMGHFEVILSYEESLEFYKLDLKDRASFILSNGWFELDDYELDDYGDVDVETVSIREL